MLFVFLVSNNIRIIQKPNQRIGRPNVFHLKSKVNIKMKTIILKLVSLIICKGITRDRIIDLLPMTLKNNNNSLPVKGIYVRGKNSDNK